MNEQKEEEEEKIGNNDIKKENEILQKRVTQLSEYTTDLNNQINKLNIKNEEQKKEINEKNNEINNLKEVSYSLINKQKSDLEKKENISPSTHFIITKKTYNKLIWYLVSNINPEDQNFKNKYNYENFSWVSGNIITPNLLNKFNKFEEDEKNDFLVEKEEEINKKDAINNKLNRQLLNKTSGNHKEDNFLMYLNLNKSNSNKNISNIKNNANSSLGDPGKNVEKYKNLLDKLNDYEERELAILLHKKNMLSGPTKKGCNSTNFVFQTDLSNKTSDCYF